MRSHREPVSGGKSLRWVASLAGTGAGLGLILSSALSAPLLLGPLLDPADARLRCADVRVTVLGTPGNDVLRAPRGGRRSVIHGSGGNDRIIGSKRRDLICGGRGDDLILTRGRRDRAFGGGGDDYIDGGSAGDDLNGGGASDLIIGGEGGDSAQGGGGNDRIYGGLQDDGLRGGADDDVIVGGHGVDKMRGEGGDDWLRGDTNRDVQYGGSGEDWVSFATGSSSGRYKAPQGMMARFSRIKPSKPTYGFVIGDDAAEDLFSIENVLGSALNDRFEGGPEGGPPLTRRVRSLAGNDVCEQFAEADCPPDSRPRPLAFVDDQSQDSGVIVLGDAAANRITVSPAGGAAVRVESAAPLTLDDGCVPAGANAALCSPSGPVLGYVFVWGGRGDDVLSSREAFPPTATVRLDGEEGRDQVTTGSGSEILDPGDTGNDLLSAGPGDDSLIARGESDHLLAGPGADQMATSEACGGHRFVGGAGKGDIAGFAITTDVTFAVITGVRARIGGKARLIYDRRAPCTPSRISRSIEILEGTDGNDALTGSRQQDILLGHEGNDLLSGRAGRDSLRGDADVDRLLGGSGVDLLYARDGTRDKRIDCGRNGGRAIRDRRDPKPRRC